MSKKATPYSPFSALKRLIDALGALDPRGGEVITCHVALERELDRALATVLPRPDRLRRLGFRHKVWILEATSPTTWIDGIGSALEAFDELRNMVAHGDPPSAIDKGYERVRHAVSELTGTEVPAKAKIGALAAGIVGALAVDTEERTKGTSTGRASAPLKLARPSVAMRAKSTASTRDG